MFEIKSKEQNISTQFSNRMLSDVGMWSGRRRKEKSPTTSRFDRRDQNLQSDEEADVNEKSHFAVLEGKG